MTKFYKLKALWICLGCFFAFALQTSSLRAQEDIYVAAAYDSPTSKNAELAFTFAYTLPASCQLDFTGVVVTPSQQVYETSILSVFAVEDAIILPTPIEVGTYTISFYIKELSPDFDSGEFGRVAITNSQNDEISSFVASTNNVSWKGQQITFQYVVTP